MALIKVKNLNWQKCEDEHKTILHREKICPLCEAKMLMLDCYEEIFGERLEDKI